MKQAGTSGGGVAQYHIGVVIENVPNYITLYNNTGSTLTWEADYIGYA